MMPVRISPISTIEPTKIADDERACIAASLEAARTSGNLDLTVLPDEVRSQLFFTLDAVARGQHVAAIAEGKPLTTTEAAELLGMSRTLLTRLCKEGRVPSFTVGTSLRIDADTVLAILSERDRVKAAARDAAATTEERRRSRAAAVAAASL